MTAYHGGKQRIGKFIAEKIYKYTIEEEKRRKRKFQGYCEPFCGMLGVYQHIPVLFQYHRPLFKYRAGDANKSVIEMWKKAKKGWKPPTDTTKKEFIKLKNGKDSALRGFVGYAHSFRGIFFNSYSYKANSSKVKTSSRKVQEIGKLLKKVTFSAKSYTQYTSLKNFVIYCDPPYSSTQQHYSRIKGIKKFDNDDFWEWCQKMAKRNIVFVSEYTKPRWVSADKIMTKGTEKLYMIQ